MIKTDQGYSIDGITIAPGVVETVISLAAAEVKGVASVGSADAFSAIISAFNAGNSIPTNGISIDIDEQENVSVSITIQARYGYRLVEIADGVRTAIADALKAQIGVDVKSVDVNIEGLTFEE